MYRELNNILLRSQSVLLLLFVLCLLPAELKAQWHKLGRYESPEPFIGLSSQSVRTMMQDSRGFIWIGTTVGLNRFDGRHVEQYINTPSDPNSISGNHIFSEGLFEHAGFIWVSTHSGGLDRFNPRNDKFEHITFQDSVSTRHCGRNIRSIKATEEHSLWLGTFQGLCKLDLRDYSVKVFLSDSLDTSTLSHNAVTSLSVDAENRLWLATLNGINLFHPETESFTRYLHSPNPDEIEPSNEFQNIEVDGENIWLGTHNGDLIKFHWPSGKTAPISIQSDKNTARVQDLFLDKDGTFWVGVFDVGLCRIDQETEDLTCDTHLESDPKSLGNNQVTSIIQDFEGHLWVGTWQGVSKRNNYTNFNNLVYSPSTPSNSLSAPLVKTIFEDDEGKVWIGSIDGGIDLYDPDSSTLRSLNTGTDGTQLHSQKVWHITGTDDTIWFSTEDGVANYNRKSNSFSNFPFTAGDTLGIQSANIYSTFIDKQKRRWVGTAATGLYLFGSEDDARPINFHAGSGDSPLLSNDIWPIFQDNEGILWFGSYSSGLYRFNEEDSTFVNYQPTEQPYGISSSNVVHITGDLDDNLWIGTTTGLNFFDKSTGKFKVYSTEDGLPHAMVNCTLLDDKNRVWISTNNGLSVLDQQASIFTNFYEQNGLAHNTFEPNACHKGKSGRFYFGTRNGVVSFFPDEVKLNSTPPKIAVAGLEVNSQPFEFNTEASSRTYTYQQNSLLFHIAPLAFVSPEGNRLRYRLLGLSDAWVDNGTNDEIDFPFLPPNEYELEVIGVNSFGIESESPLRIAFEIEPPYWQTWWFRGLMIGIGFCIAFGLYRARLNALLAIEKAKYQAEAKAKEEMDALRHRIAADFHDGLGSNIASLGLKMDLTADDDKTPEFLQHKLHNFMAHLDDISQFRRDMTWVVDSGNDTLGQLLDRITDMAFKIVPKELLSIERPSAVPEINLSMDVRQHLLFLTQEALHNAVKHAKAANIWLKIIQEGDSYTFMIKDDGIGFDPKKINKGGGMRNMPERAESINADFNINHPQEGGTEIILKITLPTEAVPKMED